jgi:hypothetical protein
MDTAFAQIGVQSITVYYKGHRGLSAEVLHLGSTGKVSAAFAHYAVPPARAV